MSPLLYHLYSGHLFFSATVTLMLVAAIDLARLFDERPLAQSVARVTGLLALALAALSGTPMPLWLAVAGGGTAIVHVVAGMGRSDVRWRKLSGAVVLAAMAAAVAIELPHHVGSSDVPRPERVVVIGDSLSSGGFGELEPWPACLGSTLGIGVLNLARAGETVSSAIDGQLPDTPDIEPGDVLIVELGGNDMLEGVGAEAFSVDLAKLSGTLSGQGAPVVMFELPVLPGRWAYAAAQRRVAGEYGMSLIPKRVLAGVLLDAKHTDDGLHLTQAGHEALAAEVAAWANWGSR